MPHSHGHPKRPDRTRRLFVKTLVAGIGLGLTGLWQRARAAADAAGWPKDAFTQKIEADAIKTLYGKDAAVFRSGQARCAGDRRKWRGGSDRGVDRARRT